MAEMKFPPRAKNTLARPSLIALMPSTTSKPSSAGGSKWIVETSGILAVRTSATNRLGAYLESLVPQLGAPALGAAGQQLEEVPDSAKAVARPEHITGHTHDAAVVAAP